MFGRRHRDREVGPDRAVEEYQWFWQTAHVSTAGASHVRNAIECQDHSDSQTFDEGRWAYVIVADGHGSARHFRSARGAEFAVQALREVFTSFRTYLEGLGPSAKAEAHWTEAARKVVSNWRARVHADLIRNPPRVPPHNGGEPGVERFFDHMRAHEGYECLDKELFPEFRKFQEYAADHRAQLPDDVPPLPLPSDPQWDLHRLGSWQATAYGTTLLGILVSPDALHWLQLGDGAMVKIVGGEADYLTPPPAEAIANETPSLCDDDAAQKIRLGTMPMVVGDFPSALILTTDGVPNSYETRAGFFQFCMDIAGHANTSPDITGSLFHWLPEISSKGSGDDMSVAMVWATEVAPTPSAEPPAQPAANDEPTENQDPEQELDSRVGKGREAR